jgi:hypothetical protein
LSGTAVGTYLTAAGGADEALVTSFRRAVAQLRQESGQNPADWRDPVEYSVFKVRNFLQIPQSHSKELKVPAMNRGTQNHLVVLSRKGIGEST